MDLTVSMDLTMCKNEVCPRHEVCWRFCCPPDQWQSYSMFEFTEDPFYCEWFIPFPGQEEFDEKEKR